MFLIHLVISYHGLRSGLNIEDPALRFEWWCNKEKELPWWFKLAMNVATIPTSSGSTERVIAVFTTSITPQMMRSKEQTAEVRTLSRYNHRQKARRRKHRFDDNIPPEELDHDFSGEEEVLEEGGDEDEPAQEAGDGARAPAAAD